MTIQTLKATLTRAWSLIGTAHHAPHPDPETAPTGVQVSCVYQAALARAEGWGVFFRGERGDGSPCYELQALDGGTPGGAGFEDDVRAWEHVVAQARAGSSLHRAALGTVDPVELRVIRYWCAAEDLVL